MFEKSSRDCITIIMQSLAKFDRSLQRLLDRSMNWGRLVAFMSQIVENRMFFRELGEARMAFEQQKEYVNNTEQFKLQQFMAQANVGSMRQFARFSDVVVQIAPSQVQQYKQGGDRSQYFKIGCFNGLKGVVPKFNLNEVNIDQPFHAFVDSIEMDIIKTQIVLRTHIGETHITESIALMFENQWRLLLSEIISSTKLAQVDQLQEKSTVIQKLMLPVGN